MANVKSIAVIGAGASGLTAIKQCVENGFNVTCFERTETFGGLWRYHDEDIDGVASVTKTTIINTSKELSAFSDFPPPDDFPNFMHNRLMWKYFEMYAKKFNLNDYIKYKHEVKSIAMSSDYEKTGLWLVTYVDDQDIEKEQHFDGVMICTGHHATPHEPKFPGQDKFQGTVIHSHSFKNADKYLDQKVVVVGVGNSGLDIATELGRIASQVYLSTRRGTWVANRTFLKGLPYDFCINSRLINTIAGYFSRPWNYLMETVLEIYFDHEAYGLKPKHRLCGQHPAIQDELANSIMSGRILVRKNIKCFTEKGVIFEGSNEEIACDTVILATGYKIGFPFIDPSIIDIVENRVELYKNVFNPRLEHPHTLAFIGLIQPLGAIFPISEMQSRWFAGLMKGQFKLPPKDKMISIMKMDNEARDKLFYASPRNTIEVHWIPYMDEIASFIGAKPNMTKLALTDPVLWYNCLLKPCVSYQYRLNGPNPWKGARQAILELDKRLYAPLKIEKTDQPNGKVRAG